MTNDELLNWLDTQKDNQPNIGRVFTSFNKEMWYAEITVNYDDTIHALGDTIIEAIANLKAQLV